MNNSPSPLIETLRATEQAALATGEAICSVAAMHRLGIVLSWLLWARLARSYLPSPIV